ncbi:MAG: type IX secretion system membrane protein PorP/SprF [Bacteroidales bacterium]|nr:type IX secretion system membrane protein PorP/SprF [Bacteroidales bacterium]
MKIHSYIRYCLFLLLSVFVGNGSFVFAQNDPQVSMYWAVPTLYNPAAVGCDSALHISAFDRMQWVGVENAPQTFFVAVDMPFKIKKVRNGVGAMVMNDKAGLFNTTQLGLQYSYSLNLDYGRLALGLQAGMVNQGFSGGEIYIPDGDAWDPSADGLPSSEVSAMAFDCGFGAYYEWNWLYGGMGIQHLAESEIELDEYAFTKLKRTYYFSVGCNIPVKRSLFIVQPSVLVKTTMQALQKEFTLRATYDHKFWGGISFRPKDAVVLMVGADVGAVRLGYSYDIGISPLAKASNGSHELMVTYSYKLDLDKQKQHAHKSIRIL